MSLPPQGSGWPGRVANREGEAICGISCAELTQHTEEEVQRGREHGLILKSAAIAEATETGYRRP